MAEIIYNDPPRRPKWVLPAVVAGGLFLACAGVLSVWLLSRFSGADEQKVRAKIIGEADDGASVSFVSWGPNDLKGEWNDLLKQQASHAGLPVSQVANVDKVYRVRYRAKNRAGTVQMYDVLALIVGDKIAIRRNEFGDNWLTLMRQSTQGRP